MSLVIVGSLNLHVDVCDNTNVIRVKPLLTAYC